MINRHHNPSIHTFSTKSFGGYFIIPLCLLIGLSFTACENLDIEPKNFIDLKIVSEERQENSITITAGFEGYQTGPIEKIGFVWNSVPQDTTIGDPDFFFNDEELPLEPGLLNLSQDLITFQGVVEPPLFLKTKIRAYLKIGKEIYYSESIEAFGQTSITVIPVKIDYQGGFSLTAFARIQGLRENTSALLSGFCWSYDNECPTALTDSCKFIENIELNDTTYTLEINDLKNNMPLRIRPVVIVQDNISGLQDTLLGTCFVPTFDGDLNFWTEKSAIGEGNLVPVTDGVAFSIKDTTNGLEFGYVGLGYSGSDVVKKFWKYDPSIGENGEWSEIAEFEGDGRDGAVAFTINGKAYVGTGFGPDSLLSDFWEYEPSNDLWHKKKYFDGGPRYKAVAFSIGDKGYVGLGEDENGNVMKDFWEFDPNDGPEGNWRPLTTAEFDGEARSDAVAFSINGKGYVGTGNRNGIKLNDFWVYDPTVGNDGVWDALITENGAVFDGDPRSGAVAFTIDGKGYVGAGDKGGNSKLNDLWQYDPSTNKWLPRAYIGEPNSNGRSGAVGFSVGGHGYIVTGANPSGGIIDLREFDP